MAPDQPLPQRVAESAHEAAQHTAHVAAEHVRERVREVKAEVKPRLRGWLHAASTPLALAAAIVLLVLSPTLATRVGSALFGATALLLFAVSATYHLGTGRWSPRVHGFLMRFDHSNIYLLIAGSYTPFALILLDGTARLTILATVWTSAVVGVTVKIFWRSAPRWVNAPVYLALGWMAIFYASDLASGGPAVTTLIVVGGALYTVGGLVYAFKRPDPFPTWFGFHEVFHTFTIAAFVCHYVAASLATYNLR